MNPTRRKTKRSFLSDKQTEENRIQLLRHGRNTKRKQDTVSLQTLGDQQQIGPRNPVQPVQQNPNDGRGPAFAYDDHIHDLAADTDLKWGAPGGVPTVQHDVPAGGDVQQGDKTNQYAKTLTVNARKHLTAQTFAAPISRVKITAAGGIGVDGSGNVQEVDKNGTTNGDAFTGYNKSWAGFRQNDFAVCFADHAGNHLLMSPTQIFLVKTSAAIVAGASGNVKLSDRDGNVTGDNFSAKNCSPNDAESGDICLGGVDRDGDPFFSGLRPA